MRDVTGEVARALVLATLEHKGITTFGMIETRSWESVTFDGHNHAVTMMISGPTAPAEMRSFIARANGDGFDLPLRGHHSVIEIKARLLSMMDYAPPLDRLNVASCRIELQTVEECLEQAA